METTANSPSKVDAVLRWLLVVFVAIVFISALIGCKTYAVVVEAPEEFWLTAENLVVALFADIWSLVGLLF